MDFTSCLFSYYDFRLQKLVVEDELVIEKDALTSQALLNLIKSKEAVLDYKKGPNFHRIADNGNPLLLADWSSQHKMSFTYPKKTNLRAMVSELRVWFTTGRIAINPRCERLIACLKEAQWKVDSMGNRVDEFARSETHGHSDILASLIYTVREASIIVNINPIPRHHGVHPTEGWISPDLEEKNDPFMINRILGDVEDQLN